MITRSIRFRMALWYATLLAGALALFGAATYLGLQRYLQKSLEESLTKQARSIGDVLLVNINQSGEDYVDNEITEHYSPEINGRFIRVNRASGRQIYVSGPPKDGTFDPALVAAPRLPVPREFTREVKCLTGTNSFFMVCRIGPATEHNSSLKLQHHITRLNRSFAVFC